MKLTKRLARTLAFPLALGTGWDKVLRNRSPHKILNIMYHGVTESDSTYFSPRHIEKNQFERQLKYLSDNFEIITIAEAFEKLRQGETVNEKYLTVSFDDGFVNNLTTALPLLEKYKIPTSFFIAGVGAMENEPSYLWSEYVAAINYFMKGSALKVGDQIFVNGLNKETGVALSDYVKMLPYEKRDQVLSEIEREYRIEQKLLSLPPEVWKLMDRKELTEFSRSKFVTIGSHALRHYNLGLIDREKAGYELSESKRILEEVTGKAVNSIAYPDGSYDETVKDLAESAGYTQQLAVDYRCTDDVNDPRIMNRYGISSTTTYASNMLFLNKAFLRHGIQSKHV